MNVEIAQPAGVAGQVFVFDGLMSSAVCEKFLEQLKPVYSSVAEQGRTMGGVFPETKTSVDALFSQQSFAQRGVSWLAEFAEADRCFQYAMRQALAIVKNSLRALHSWSSISDTGFQIQHYPQCEGFYREHVDSFPASPVTDRVVSAIVYLNDVEIGGETAFVLHDCAIKPRAGRVVVFPASWTHPHEGRTPISADKWIMNTFLVNAENHHQHDHDHGVMCDHEH